MSRVAALSASRARAGEPPACYAAAVVDPHEITPDAPRPLRRAEYERLAELGVFEGERVELIDGVVVQMSPHGPSHDSAVSRLNRVLMRALADRAEIRIQSAYAAGDSSEPEPDVAVVPLGDYERAHPSEAYLLIEVAESSLKKDRGVKASLYAASNVTEYWVVDLVDRAIHVFRGPAAGGYADASIARRGDVLAIARFSDVSVPVDVILPG